MSLRRSSLASLADPTAFALMAKYDPLRRYLARQKTAEVDLTFSEIERLIGALLPKRATQAGWWDDTSPGQTPSIQSAAWREARFRAELQPGDRVRFVRG
jgi:hypothetical protein